MLVDASERGASLDEVFAALAHPTRRAILEFLSQREATITELAAPFDLSLPAISKHIRVLSDAGLLIREKRGRERHCRLRDASLLSAVEWIVRHGRFWDEQLDSLATFLVQHAESSHE